jgi:hypothetical protein
MSAISMFRRDSQADAAEPIDALMRRLKGEVAPNRICFSSSLGTHEYPYYASKYPTTLEYSETKSRYLTPWPVPSRTLHRLRPGESVLQRSSFGSCSLTILRPQLIDLDRHGIDALAHAHRCVAAALSTAARRRWHAAPMGARVVCLCRLTLVCVGRCFSAPRVIVLIMQPGHQPHQAARASAARLYRGRRQAAPAGLPRPAPRRMRLRDLRAAQPSASRTFARACRESPLTARSARVYPLA